MPASVPSTRNPFLLGSSRTTRAGSLSGSPLAIEVQVLPPSCVLKTNGLLLSTWCRSKATYAVFTSKGDASICCTRPHSDTPCAVTFDQCWPPSLVICTKPSSVPTQITFASTGETAIDKMVSKVSAPLRSSSTGPPLDCCLALSLRVRSGEIGCHFLPPSVERKSTLPARKTSLGSLAETAMREVQLKRYLKSAGAKSLTPCR